MAKSTQGGSSTAALAASASSVAAAACSQPRCRRCVCSALLEGPTTSTCTFTPAPGHGRVWGKRLHSITQPAAGTEGQVPASRTHAPDTRTGSHICESHTACSGPAQASSQLIAPGHDAGWMPLLPRVPNGLAGRLPASHAPGAWLVTQ